MLFYNNSPLIFWALRCFVRSLPGFHTKHRRTANVCRSTKIAGAFPSPQSLLRAADSILMDSNEE